MAYRQLPGQADTPKRVQPEPEHYAGVNFPYRGTETHGVEPPHGAEYDTREFQYPEEHPIKYLPEEEEKPPIDVRVVNSSARERLDWRAVRVSVDDTGQQILGRHDKRSAVRIRNHDATNPVYIGRSNGVQSYTGFMIPANSELYPFRSTEEIWGITDSGNVVEVSVMYDFAVEL